MNWALTFHLLAMGVTVVLGALVFRTNPRRVTNQIFLFMSGLLLVWLFCLGMGFTSRDPKAAMRLIRGCLCVGAFFPLSFEWMRASIVSPGHARRAIAGSSPLWLTVTIGMAVAAASPYLVVGVQWPATSGEFDVIPEPVYGPAFLGYVTAFILSLGLLVWRFLRSLPRYARIQREELLFILLGAGTSIFMVVVLSMVIPLITGRSLFTQFTPVAVIVLYGVIAYGIATRRIMGVAYFMRLATSYALLAAYLTLLYLAVWWVTRGLARGVGLRTELVPYLLASLAVAFSLAPAQGWMQRFANRLFIRTASLDVGTVIQSASRILRSISTVDTLLADFADSVGRALGTDRVSILLPEADGFLQRFPRESGGDPATLALNAPLIRVLSETGEPLVPELARRVRNTPATAEAIRAVEATGMAAAIGMQSPQGLEGLVMLGPRLSGRIYGAPEQQALQLLCNQLAVALNNARLYTQVQDGKIYNDILVDNLASGVMVAGTDGTLTVFNREAHRITGLKATDVLGCPTSVLPPALASAFDTTLKERAGHRDRELLLERDGGEETPVSVSSALFYGHTGRLLGAVLVVNDLTAVKRLEQQIRRSDRLASLGTLAAGMAHEIKNPLVSIKTFTQLMPERYAEAEFRDTFFSLVSHEVKRIDSIVNQLLRFSRPAKPNLANTSLHDILTSTLNLMAQQLRHKNIQLVMRMEAPQDRILADGDQLSQAFINFILNAVESMPQGGTLTVTTGAPDAAYCQALPSAQRRPLVQVTITDTGEGIEQGNLAHIFDPFFTTKSQGTGLGLSVAHGIIAEHGGIIDVTSEPGRGTSFHLLFPLSENGAAA